MGSEMCIRDRYAAIILAAAGLIRLGLEARIAQFIPTTSSIPAVGQGALGIEINANRQDLLTVLAPLNHAETAASVEAERGMSRALAGSCTVPLGAYAEVLGNTIKMTGFVASVNGAQMIKQTVTGTINDPEGLGKLLAQKLTDLGADKILAELPKA